MLCKICGRDISGKFYLHLNGSHKMRKDDYLQMFPEQAAEYDGQVPKQAWNKGLTKHTHPSVARCAEQAAVYSRREDVRIFRSEHMKQRYEGGDIVDSATRARIVEAGTHGWVKKIQSASEEERRKLLFAFTRAGNARQEELRATRTPEDFQKLYPWAKGIATWGSCYGCGKQMIIWLGGKPRPKRRFCSSECCVEYRKKHPYFTFETGMRYYSTKMETEFYLRSNLEVWFAETLDACEKVRGWIASPCSIEYGLNGKTRTYHPDFLVDGYWLMELKSGYVYSIRKEETEAKLKAATKYASNNGLEFVYWQFNESNMTAAKFAADLRVKAFMGE
jgi:hypothetical protein